MDNKGMTLVELIITFALLLVIVVGLYNLILEIKLEMDDKQIAKNLTEYSATVNNDIHYNLLKDKPFAIAIKEKSTSSWTCTNCTVSGNTVSVPSPKTGVAAKSFSNLNTVCKNIYPCATYFYVNGTTITQKVIALNRDNDTNTNELLTVKGVLYGPESGPLFEAVPDNDYIEIRDMNLVNAETGLSTREADMPYIKIKNNILVINYALYIIDDDHNYGFKIAYPLS